MLPPQAHRQPNESISDFIDREYNELYGSVPHVDLATLSYGDRVVFGNDNRWTVVKKIDAECECGQAHVGWVMRHRSEYQVWWKNDRVWKRTVLLKHWPKKRVIMDEWRERELAADRQRKRQK